MDGAPVAAFAESHRSGRLTSAATEAAGHLRCCDLCPRGCGVDRLAGERGFCSGGARAAVASAGPHFGEEAPLVGRRGSGTIFFARCNLLCVFCQNWEISHSAQGVELDAGDLAGMMLELQREGCHNINLVTPTHFLPQILAALDLAAALGLTIPLVWNCGGYESAGMLRLLDGIVDIYMPDIKFSDPAVADRFCGAPDYFDRARDAVREMHRQIGDLAIGPDGIARRGLLVRHLVMPGGLAGTGEIVRFLAAEISRDTWLNVMDQYHPCGSAGEAPGISRRIHAAEYAAALRLAAAAGLHRGFPIS